jgi:hypothetical protein
MSIEDVVKKLPRSDEEVEIVIESQGDDGGDIKIDIDVPGPHDVSDRTKEEYADHIWTGAGKFWHDVLNDSIQKHEVKSNTYSTNSGNVGLTSCYIQIDYFEEPDIEGVIKRLLVALDKAIMTEQRNQEAIKKSAEAAQEAVCEDISSRIEGIELE